MQQRRGMYKGSSENRLPGRKRHLCRFLSSKNAGPQSWASVFQHAGFTAAAATSYCLIHATHETYVLPSVVSQRLSHASVLRLT